MVRSFSVAAAVLGVWVFGATHSYAQQGTGELRGRVLDAQGAVLPGVAVVAKNEATGQVREIVTGGDGSFFMSALTPGVYEHHGAARRLQEVSAQRRARRGRKNLRPRRPARGRRASSRR